MGKVAGLPHTTKACDVWCIINMPYGAVQEGKERKKQGNNVPCVFRRALFQEGIYSI